jgi:hypothetical protein
MTMLYYLVPASIFFYMIGRESRVPGWLWVVISLGVFFAGGLLTQTGMVGGMIAQAILFIVLSVIWVMKPRATTKDIDERIKTRIIRKDAP